MNPKLLELYAQYQKLSDGGKVQPAPSPSPAPNLDPAKVQQFLSGFKGYADGGQVTPNPIDIAQDSMRKAFHFADGGDVLPQIDPNDLAAIKAAQHQALGASFGSPVPSNGMGDVHLRELYQQYLNMKNPQKYADGGQVGMGDVKQAERNQTMPSLSEALGEMFERNKAKPTPSPKPENYADGGEVERDPQSKKDMSDSSQQAQQDLSKAQKNHKKVMQDLGDEDIPEPVQKLAEGGPALSPAEFQAHLDSLRAQGMKIDDQGQGPEQNVMGASPTPISSVEESEDPSDKELDNEMADEDFEAGEKADEEGKEDDKSDEEKDDNDSTSSPRNLAGQTLNKAEAQAQNPDLTPSTPGQPSVSPVVQSQFPSLMEAQKARDQALSEQQMSRGAALMGAGIARVSPDANMAVINANDKMAALPMQKFQEQMANQQNDPNSNMSQVARDYFKSKGLKVPDNASLSDILKVAPYYAKDQALQQALWKTVYTQGQQNTRAKQSVEAGNKRSTDRDNALIESSKIRANAMKAGQQNAMTRQDNTRIDKLGKDLVEEMSSGRTAFGRAATNMQSIDNVDALLNGTKNLNDITPQQVFETAKVLDRVLSQSGSTVEGTKHLTPDTAAQRLAELQQYITNKVHGANAASFLQNMRHTFERERQQAQRQLDVAKRKRMAPDKDLFEKYPDRIGEIMDANGVSRKYFDTKAGSAQGMHKPGDIVEIKGKGKFRVGDDGDSLEEIK